MQALLRQTSMIHVSATVRVVERLLLTAALVSTEDSVTEDLAAGVDGGADFLCVSTRAHGINVHLILSGHGLQEL